MAEQTPIVTRDVVFISKATPGDDEFVLWLAPRLEAAGYTVFADILCLDAGGRWRRQITSTLQDRAVKMLLCCQDSTLEREGVQEEISIASDLVRELKDPTFIIPLKLKRFRKLFGIADLQYIDFEKSWAGGLTSLLAALEKQGVPRSNRVGINHDWEAYRRRDAIAVLNESEALTSNWVRIVEQPNHIRYFEPTGAIDHAAMKRACGMFRYPAEIFERGFFSFATQADVEEHFSGVGMNANGRSAAWTNIVGGALRMQLASDIVRGLGAKGLIPAADVEPIHLAANHDLNPPNECYLD